jgi:hypothetical protein
LHQLDLMKAEEVPGFLGSVRARAIPDGVSGKVSSAYADPSITSTPARRPKILRGRTLRIHLQILS